VTPATVYLVGAGPGDPGLLTVRAVECLGRADVVLYDYLADPAVLEHAALSAVLVPLGDHEGGRILTPEEITRRMVAEARAGRTVVRLKGGDPCIFGRAADETEALREAGVPFEIVPGVTSGLAVAAYCEIPLTHQDEASCVALVTAHERSAKEESGVSRLDFAALAAFPGTLVFYMGVGRVAQWSAALMEHGRKPDTPVAVVRWCSRANQETVRCTLGTAASVVAERGLRPPAVFVVGGVVERAPELSWFTARPLFGTRVLVPSAPGTSRKLRDRLVGLGAEVIVQPAIRITAPPEWTPLDAALEAVDGYDWVVFTSANGVEAFMDRLLGSGGDARRLHRVRLAVVGSGTAEKLASYGLKADRVAETFVTESLANSFLDEAAGTRFLLVQGSRAREVLSAGLRMAGAEVDDVVAYGSEDVMEADPETAAAFAAGEIDWITVTSASVVHSLVRLYGDSLRSARFASIGPVTSAALRDLCLEPDVEACPHTVSGLVDAILAGRPR
jgi:uroporphyrinogen III methyltransferase / synthase